MKRRALLLLATLTPLPLPLGCKADPDREAKKFEKLKENASEYTTRWPGFQTAVNAQLKQAESKLSEAKQVSDAEKRGEAMAAANEVAGKLIHRLGEVKYKSEGLEKTIKKLRALKLPRSKSSTRKTAVANAEKALMEVEQTMKSTEVSTEAAALTALDPIVGKLITAEGNASRRLKALKKT